MYEVKTVVRTFESNDRQRRYLEEHTQCAMCETELAIDHKIDPGGGMMKEEAHCPTCGVRVRAVRHRVH